MKVSKLFRRLMDELNGDGDQGSSAPTAPAADNTPAPQSDNTPAVEDSTSDAPSDPMWADLADEVDEVAPDVEPAVSEPQQAQPQPQTPQTPQTQQPDALTQQAAEPGQPPVQPAQAPEAQAPQVDPQVAETARKAAETAYMQQLEKMYSFDDDTAVRLQTEPEKVLPTLAARLHMDVMRTVMAQVQGILPQTIAQQTTHAKRVAEAENMFFSKWPDLKSHADKVLQIGAMYRQVNPKASAEDAIAQIGQMTYAALGMALPQGQSQQQQTDQVPAAAAFQPAVPGRVNGGQQTPTIWESLADEDD